MVSWLRPVIVLLVLVAVIPAGTSYARDPDLRLKPNDGAPGESVEARGKNWEPGAQGLISWPDGAPLVEFTADEGGQFSATFTVPDVAAGSYDVIAEAPLQHATDQFEVNASNKVEPAPAVEIALPAMPSAPSCPDAGQRIVHVGATDELISALESATPGDVILLGDGIYRGQFVLDTDGTEGAPITICGSRQAVLEGGGIRSGYGLHVLGDHITIMGITVRNSQKGIVLDGSSHCLITGVEVHTIGDEAIHLRSFSSDNIVRDSAVHDTGMRRDKFGEGIYVGSAVSNWGSYSGGEPDASDRNQIINNVIWNTTAEAIDIKEGTSSGVIDGNWFDGTLLSGADSWVDIKGSDYLIVNNVGQNAPVDGFQTHVINDMEWGTGNRFAENSAEVNGSGYGFYIHQPETAINIVACANTVTNAGKGASNIACSD